MVGLCNEIVNLIDSKLMTGITGEEEEVKDTQVFYYKMKGDYYRYAAEAGDKSAVENGRLAYSQA